MSLATHPNYPTRIDDTDENYDINCPFYEDPVLEKSAGVWADYVNVPEQELRERFVWYNNELLALEDSNIKFKNGKPICEIRTGIKGRGMLGRYGPNHAADPIVTKFNFWKWRFEFVSAQRIDTSPPQWCIPGGMVDPGESVSLTLRREFKEEVASECDDSILNAIFKNGTCLYSGPTCGDPRTTDDAWIETRVVHYHLSNKLANKIKLTHQPEENRAVQWISCDHPELYGDHAEYVHLAKKNAKSIMIKNLASSIINCAIMGGLIYMVVKRVSA
tara:strand:- start:271 stop:1095 length:825 start_codon:yes stop_codon:yes gene_type:complete